MGGMTERGARTSELTNGDETSGNGVAGACAGGHDFGEQSSRGGGGRMTLQEADEVETEALR